MFSSVYIEEAVRDSARVRSILQRIPEVPRIAIQQYGEVFNRAKQNFRLQKQQPALILAHKSGRRVLPTPEGYGFESGSAGKGFYFSHMLNCVYDCRYCFLQGMFRSANYVLFVNYEDFEQDIEATIAHAPAGSVFYSGYDCDSLALEPVSAFCESFLPCFQRHPEHFLEIRTKSTQIRFLLEREPLANCVIAMSFSPQVQSEQWEHKVPSIAKRLDALVRLQNAGWPVALRFEPVIAQTNTLSLYKELFELVFSQLDRRRIHSASLGEFRLPVDYYKKIVKLYPEEPLLARETQLDDGMVSLAHEQESLLQDLETMLLAYIEPESYYRCA
ncbi:MAG: hypothetical protein MI746_07065 [Pseudomonadales bacterium]|nr:hypothetical protein [Pseudomonadales bacterium]